MAMPKKIVILNGSPRLNGNTAELCSAFTEGAETAGHSVTRFDLQTMNIHPCLGCFKGGKDPASPCAQKDDMDKIYSVYREADIVVFASPLYCWSFSAQLKCAFDRLFAVTELEGYTKKGCVLLVASTGTKLEPVVHYYKAAVQNMQWYDCGMVLASGNREIGDIQNRPRQLEEARALGRTL